MIIHADAKAFSADAGCWLTGGMAADESH